MPTVIIRSAAQGVEDPGEGRRQGVVIGGAANDHGRHAIDPFYPEPPVSRNAAQ